MSTLIHTHTQLSNGTSTRAGRQTARQTLTCIQRASQKGSFFSSSLLSRLNKQTWLSRSLYSCADFCVSVCFNLNGFQVPSLPKSASSFSLFDPAADIEALLLASLPLSSSFSHFPLNPQETSQCAIYHSLLLTSASPFALTFFFFSLSLHSRGSRGANSLNSPGG